MIKRPFVPISFLGLILVLVWIAGGGRADLSGAGSRDELGQIEKSIRDCIGWAKEKDFRLLYSVVANDADFLEVHPDGKVVKGLEEFKKAETFWASPDFKAVRYEIRDLKIQLSKSGDVAWFFCILDDINEWKGRPANWENTRWTGVLEKREGRWVMVQQHFSFAETASAGQAARRDPLILSCVANAGVLVSSGGSKVLIDALFDKPNPEYRAPSPEMIDRMMRGEAPFDGVDLVLVTHDHPDHFDPALAVRYLEAVPGPIVLAPADAVEEMRKAAPDWGKIASRVVPLDLKVGEQTKRELNGIPIAAFRTLHGQLESPMNVMYLLDLGGWRIFHEGDSPGNVDEYRAFGLGNEPVDLALVHFWFPLEPQCARFLQIALRPGHIALTHLPVRLEGDAPGKIDQVRPSYKDVFLLLPGMPDRIFRAD
jgi:L-ascorbate metabolism protein UlaG (beta-lactamase superfamily)/ketosteroid isomerase-like protein